MTVTTTPDGAPACPRCGIEVRGDLTHGSIVNDHPDTRPYPPAPYVCIVCMLVELEEYRRNHRVLPYRQWWCNDPEAWALFRNEAAVRREARGLTDGGRG